MRLFPFLATFIIFLDACWGDTQTVPNEEVAQTEVAEVIPEPAPEPVVEDEATDEPKAVDINIDQLIEVITSATFDNLVTDQVVELALDEYLHRFASWEVDLYPLRPGSYAARDAAFNLAVVDFGVSRGQTGMTVATPVNFVGDDENWSKYDQYRELILTRAKRHLANPDNLRAFYRAHQATVVTVLRQSEHREQIVEMLDTVVTYTFRRPIPNNVRQAHQAIIAAEKADTKQGKYPCLRISYWLCDSASQRQANQRFDTLAAKAGFPHPELLLFRLRREQEAHDRGAELSAAYADVSRDLSAALR